MEHKIKKKDELVKELQLKQSQAMEDMEHTIKKKDELVKELQLIQ